MHLVAFFRGTASVEARQADSAGKTRTLVHYGQPDQKPGHSVITFHQIGRRA